MTWKRARQPWRKEQRRQTMLEAAALSTEYEYRHVSISAIVERAGFGKED